MLSNHSTRSSAQLPRKPTNNVSMVPFLLPVPINKLGFSEMNIPKVTIGSPELKTTPRSKQTTPKNGQVLSSNLSEKIAGDILVAAGVTFAFSPFLTIVDKAIIQRAAGTHTIAKSCLETFYSMARNPITFVKSPSFLMMWGVYAATYTTANCLKTLVEHQEYMDRRAREKLSDRGDMGNNGSNIGKTATFLGTTIVNSTASIMKDRWYARMFGTSGVSSKIPAITMGLWASRDIMVIGSSFVLPELMSVTLKEQTSLKEHNALRISQFLCPILTQVFAGPVQLLGLDFYNRPMGNIGYTEAATERAKFVGQNFSSVVAARVARMAPAYGIGGIGNTYFRNAWRSMLIRREMELLDVTEKKQDRRERVSNLVRLVVAKERGERDLRAGST